MSSNKLVQKYKDRLSLSHKKFEKQAEGNIARWRDYYRGNQWTSGLDAYTDKTLDNQVFSIVKTVMPSINFNNPKILSRAKKKPYRTEDGTFFDTIRASVIVEILLNCLFKELRMKRQIDKCILDALLGPWGILQFGYTLETEKQKAKEILEVNEIIKSDSPFAVRRSPMDFRVDTEAVDHHLEDAEWVAFKWVKRLEDVKNNPQYKNTDKLEANSSVKREDKRTDSDEQFDGDEADYERVEGWDIWDKKNQTLLTVVEGHDKFLQDREWPLKFDGGFPVETIYFNENPDEIFPISDVDIYIHAQDELNRLRSLHLEHVKKLSQRKYTVEENAYETEEIRKITHGPSGSVAMRKSGAPPIEPIKEATASQDIYMAIRLLKDDIRENSGLSLLEKGVSQKFDTATEPRLLAEGSSHRRAERVSIVEDFIVRSINKVFKIVQQTMEAGNETRALALNEQQFKLAQQFVSGKLERITGANGVELLYPWLNVGYGDVQGDYDFEIEVGSTRRVDEEQRRRDAAALYQLLGSNPFIRPDEGAKRLLEAFDIKDYERLIKNQQEVMKERLKNSQMQVQMEAAKNMPKRQTDMAKAKLKAQVSLATSKMKKDTEEKNARVSLLQEALKSKPKIDRNESK